MNTPETLRAVVLQSLSGRGSHVPMRDAVDGLDWEQAGRTNAAGSHSVFEIVNHLDYWQAFALAWLDGDKPATPEHAAESWPGATAPVDEADWDRAVGRLLAGLDELEDRARDLDLLAARGAKSVLEIVQMIATHNSYHVGQIAAARKRLEAWPPPAGGATW